jgi:hypothetical protein
LPYDEWDRVESELGASYPLRAESQVRAGKTSRGPRERR